VRRAAPPTCQRAHACSRGAGMVPITTGEIAEDIATYLNQARLSENTAFFERTLNAHTPSERAGCLRHRPRRAH